MWEVPTDVVEQKKDELIYAQLVRTLEKPEDIALSTPRTTVHQLYTTLIRRYYTEGYHHIMDQFDEISLEPKQPPRLAIERMKTMLKVLADFYKIYNMPNRTLEYTFGVSVIFKSPYYKALYESLVFHVTKGRIITIDELFHLIEAHHRHVIEKKCFNCHEVGHKRVQCPKWKRIVPA